MKKVEVKDGWVEKYTGSLASHISFYRQAADKLGVEKELVLKHDDSKNTDEEFPWYVRRFGGGIKDDPEWPSAWNHHIHNNPHHWEYWITPGGEGKDDEIVQMPDKYVTEMVADWLGSGRAYTGSWDMAEWLSNNLYRVRLHPESMRTLDKVLAGLGYKSSDLLKWRLKPKN